VILTILCVLELAEVPKVADG